jgi:hypothetical protein
VNFFLHRFLAEPFQVGLLRGIHADALPLPAPDLEFNVAVDFGKDGVIFAHSYVVAGVESGPTLAHDNVAGTHGFPAELFHSSPLGVAVTTIAAAAATFFVSHNQSPLANNFINT